MRRNGIDGGARGTKARGGNARLAAPAAPDLEVLAVDLLVRVDRAGPDVGVVPGDTSGRRRGPGQASRLRRPSPPPRSPRPRPRRGSRAHRVEPLAGRRAREVEHTSAPISRASASRSAGAPIAKTATAPARRASAMALRPTAPVPCTSTCRRGGARRARGCAPRSAVRSRRRCSRRTSTASGSRAIPTPGSR